MVALSQAISQRKTVLLFVVVFIFGSTLAAAQFLGDGRGSGGIFSPLDNILGGQSLPDFYNTGNNYIWLDLIAYLFFFILVAKSSLKGMVDKGWDSKLPVVLGIVLAVSAATYQSSVGFRLGNFGGVVLTMAILAFGMMIFRMITGQSDFSWHMGSFAYIATYLMLNAVAPDLFVRIHSGIPLIGPGLDIALVVALIVSGKWLWSEGPFRGSGMPRAPEWMRGAARGAGGLAAGAGGAAVRGGAGLASGGMRRGRGLFSRIFRRRGRTVPVTSAEGAAASGAAQVETEDERIARIQREIRDLARTSARFYDIAAKYDGAADDARDSREAERYREAARVTRERIRQLEARLQQYPAELHRDLPVLVRDTNTLARTDRNAEHQDHMAESVIQHALPQLGHIAHSLEEEESKLAGLLNPGNREISVERNIAREAQAFQEELREFWREIIALRSYLQQGIPDFSRMSSYVASALQRLTGMRHVLQANRKEIQAIERALQQGRTIIPQIPAALNEHQLELLTRLITQLSTAEHDLNLRKLETVEQRELQQFLDLSRQLQAIPSREAALVSRMLDFLTSSDRIINNLIADLAHLQNLVVSGRFGFDGSQPYRALIDHIDANIRRMPQSSFYRSSEDLRHLGFAKLKMLRQMIPLLRVLVQQINSTEQQQRQLEAGIVQSEKGIERFGQQEINWVSKERRDLVREDKLRHKIAEREDELREISQKLQENLQAKERKQLTHRLKQIEAELKRLYLEMSRVSQDASK